MDPEELQAIAARDQLWSSLRPLAPEIEKLAGGAFSDSERERQMIQILARVVIAEMQYRTDHCDSE